MPAPATAICIACLRCRHRGVIDADSLAGCGLPARVDRGAVPPRLVCQACGSKAMSVERRLRIGSLGQQLRGQVHVAYEPSGVTYTLDVPVGSLVTK